MNQLSTELFRIAHEICAKKFKVLCIPRKSGYAVFSVQIEASSYGEATKAAAAMFDKNTWSFSIIG